MSRVKLWTGLALLFGAGVVTGALGTWLSVDLLHASRGDRGPAAQHERIMKRLTQELSLTPQQRSEIEPIVTEAHVAILDLRFSHQDEVEQILFRGMEGMKAKLSPEQRAELDRLYARLQQRWQTSRSYLQEQKQHASQPPMNR
ncbi:MAG TPA: hypothetical protein VFS39_17975 [Nitrospira sp.]|nr:hypothetical protein [Nitrospira sp.]